MRCSAIHSGAVLALGLLVWALCLLAAVPVGVLAWWLANRRRRWVRVP